MHHGFPLAAGEESVVGSQRKVYKLQIGCIIENYFRLKIRCRLDVGFSGISRSSCRVVHVGLCERIFLPDQMNCDENGNEVEANSVVSN